MPKRFTLCRLVAASEVQAIETVSEPGAWIGPAGSGFFLPSRRKVEAVVTVEDGIADIVLDAIGLDDDARRWSLDEVERACRTWLSAHGGSDVVAETIRRIQTLAGRGRAVGADILTAA